MKLLITGDYLFCLIGDLTIEVIHPDGTTVMLHNQEGGSTNDLVHTYGFSDKAFAGLNVLLGKRIEGVWKLRIQDNAGSDTGTLLAANLIFKGFLN